MRSGSGRNGETTGLASHELVERTSQVVFTGKPGVKAPKTLLAEDDIDITDLSQVAWATPWRALVNWEKYGYR
ncbi:hypothetical protein AB0N05_03055 [Nocardia sp. NPDC051030]|uniref:hypothetical protein n=1 Tax=Nocardia sp. NPDC051030 TaxID=3155162 RepID=UPI00341F5CCB